MRKRYSLYKRTKSPYYQVQFVNDDGSSGIQMSSGKKNKAEASRWADEMLEKGLIQTVRTEIVILDELGKGFFDYNGEWATMRRTSGYRLSEQQCAIKQKIYENYISPFMGKYKLTEINNVLVDKFREHLLKSKSLTSGRPLTGSSINKILSSLNTLIVYAERKDLIRRAPSTQRVSPQLHRKDRKTLHHNDVIKIFADRNAWKYQRTTNTDKDYKNFGQQKRFKNDHLDAENLRAYTLCYLAWKTGMRESELQALTHSDLEFTETGETIISINRSWSKFSKKLNTTTKTGKTGAVPIGITGTELIRSVMAMNPYGIKQSGFLFYGSNKAEPISRESIRRPLQHALKNVLGLTGSEFTLHSFRHQCNSELLASGMSGDRVRSVLRHTTVSMTQNYSHNIGEYRDILAAQKKMDEII